MAQDFNELLGTVSDVLKVSEGQGFESLRARSHSSENAEASFATRLSVDGFVERAVVDPRKDDPEVHADARGLAGADLITTSDGGSGRQRG